MWREHSEILSASLTCGHSEIWSAYAACTVCVDTSAPNYVSENGILRSQYDRLTFSVIAGWFPWW